MLDGSRTASLGVARDERSALEAAESHLTRAKALEQQASDCCVDEYFTASAWAWKAIAEEVSGQANVPSIDCYNTALSSLLAAACRFQRWDAERRLIIKQAHSIDTGHGQQASTQTIPVSCHGFQWQPCDFQRLERPTTYQSPLLRRYYAARGVGIPLVAERKRDGSHTGEARFFAEKMFWSTTAVLQFADSAADSAALPLAVLQLYNPLEVQHVAGEGCGLPLAHDLTAPLANMLEAAPRSYLAGFIEPGGATQPRLTFLEPYQPGKAPVVLIHGLFSDPQAWADMINDLRAAPGFMQRHQIWVFRYPTGQGFLQSAAVLRRELKAAACALDRDQEDAALHNITLIGHSMGGLIAKLQVSYSDELIWSRLAKQPLDEIVTTEATREFLAEASYFDPLDSVQRVIFIASPHGGSLRSSGLFGRGAALLVEPAPQQEQMLAQLLRDNPGTFNPVVERGLPTSIDMLIPSSPLLDAMRQMRQRPGVKLYNMVGVWQPLSLDGPSDGVVSVASASHPRCESVLPINSPHAKVHRTIAASQEVLRILSCH